MSNENQYQPFDLWEERRQSMGWYFSRAFNARMSAYVLYFTEEDQWLKLSKEANYKGDWRFPKMESFHREAAIALELISKASLATHIKAGSTKSGRKKMPNTHNLFDIFDDIGLELKTDKQAYVLDLMTETLFWSGRYGAPAKGKPETSRGKKYDRMINAASQSGKMIGDMHIHHFPSLDWIDFDNLFQLAFETIVPDQLSF